MRPHLCGPMISTMPPRCWLADGSYYVGRADESSNMFDRHASSPPRMGGSKIARGSSRGSTAAVGQLELASRSPYLNRAMLRCIVQGEVLVTSDLASVQRPVLPSAMTDQLNLFESKPALPEGFRYHPDLLDVGEERVMVAEIERLLFKEFEFHGFAARRRVVSFGWQYDFPSSPREGRSVRGPRQPHPRTPSGDRIRAGRPNRLAQGSCHRRHRHLSAFSVHISFPQKLWQRLGASFAPPGTAFRIPPPRALPQ